MNHRAIIEKIFNIITQFALPPLTIGSQLLVATKFPQWGLTVNLIAQPFWLYSTWRAYKQAGQSGILITTIIMTIITLFGVINYWFIK